MKQQCYFCENDAIDRYTITEHFRLIKALCAHHFSLAQSTSPFSWRAYPRLASLEEAEEALIRLKLFGELP